MAVTIQRTSKPLKSLLLISNAMQIFGWLSLFQGEHVNPPVTLTLIFGGIAMHIITRALIWWCHD